MKNLSRNEMKEINGGYYLGSCTITCPPPPCGEEFDLICNGDACIAVEGEYCKATDSSGTFTKRCDD